MITPIIFFAFNRPNHLRQALAALASNELANQSDIHIFCDGPRTDSDHADEYLLTNEVRKIAHATKGFASLRVVKREQNLGCANSIISGLNEMFAEHERLIIIEDDIVTSTYTLQFLNQCLDKYAHETTVFNISAWSPPPSLMPISVDYPYDVYAIPRFNCWGWATWRDRWQRIDWNVSDYDLFISNSILQHAYNEGGQDLSSMLTSQIKGEINTWDIRMDYARFKHGCVGINPVRSYTTNIGNDASGTHCGVDSRYDNDIYQAISKPHLIEHIFVDQNISAYYKKVYSSPSFAKRILNKIFRLLKVAINHD